jgi:hypothetical protein
MATANFPVLDSNNRIPAATRDAPSAIKTASYTAAHGDIARFNCTGGAITQPFPAGGAGTTFIVKKTDTSANVLTITPPSGFTMTGAAGATVSSIPISYGDDGLILVVDQTGTNIVVAVDAHSKTGILAIVAATSSGDGLNSTTVTGNPTAANQTLLSTAANAASWAAGATVDTTDIPLAPSTNPTPGTGTNGVSPSDHAHPLPTLSQLTTLGVSTPTSAPLWAQLTGGELTLSKGHKDDSGSYTSTPASGTVHYTYFIAQQSHSIGHIRFGTGGTGQTTGTYMNVGLYTVNVTTGALTQVAVGTAETTTQGGYGTQVFAMTTAYAITAGVMYCVGFLQVAATAASLLGEWDNIGSGDTQPLACTGATGLSTLPATAAKPTNGVPFPVYYELYA